MLYVGAEDDEDEMHLIKNKLLIFSVHDFIFKSILINDLLCETCLVLMLFFMQRCLAPTALL